MATLTLTGADLTLLGYTVQVRDTEYGIAVTLRNAAGDPVNAGDLPLPDAEPREIVDEFETFALRR